MRFDSILAAVLLAKKGDGGLKDASWRLNLRRNTRIGDPWEKGEAQRERLPSAPQGPHGGGGLAWPSGVGVALWQSVNGVIPKE